MENTISVKQDIGNKYTKCVLRYPSQKQIMIKLTGNKRKKSTHFEMFMFSEKCFTDFFVGKNCLYFLADKTRTFTLYFKIVLFVFETILP